MPIQLTAPFDPGDTDPGKTYAQIKIVSFQLEPDRSQIVMQCEYGNTVSGAFEKGTAPSMYHAILNKPDDTDPVTFLPIPNTADPQYDNMVANTSAASGEIYYTEVSARLYQWLIDEGIYVGAIV